jgi:hypothetical protein
MNRRMLLKLAATSSLLATSMPLTRSFAESALPGKTRRRVRPSEQSWPSLAEWQGLNQTANGRLTKIESPLAACADNPDTPVCQELLRNLRNPFFHRQPALGDAKQRGWADAWVSSPSLDAVAVQGAADVAAAVGLRSMRQFARTLTRNIEAVRHAIMWPWSNGHAEGQINRLKTFKRSLYGRGGIELLRARMPPPEPKWARKVNNIPTAADRISG